MDGRLTVDVAPAVDIVLVEMVLGVEVIVTVDEISVGDVELVGMEPNVEVGLSFDDIVSVKIV